MKSHDAFGKFGGEGRSAGLAAARSGTETSVARSVTHGERVHTFQMRVIRGEGRMYIRLVRLCVVECTWISTGNWRQRLVTPSPQYQEGFTSVELELVALPMRTTGF